MNLPHPLSMDPYDIANALRDLDRRLTALETRPCSPASSASPAAAPGTSPTSPQPSAGSVGGGREARGESEGSDSPSRGGASPSSPSSAPCSSTGSTPDPTAAIRADPKRPKWLTDAMLPLPPNTERIWIDGRRILRAYPCGRWFRDWCGDWGGIAEDEGTAEAMPGSRVYHVPQPAPADKPMILPPAEMPEALRPYWTPESRVYIDWARSVYVYPSQMAMIASCGIPFKAAHSEAKVVDKNCTLLPNRTVTTESILGTAAAAKAVEQGVADVLEGRTRQVDSLDQLAAEAQAEGEYAKPPTPRRTAREVAEEFQLILMPGVTRMMSDGYWRCSDRTVPAIKKWISAAIERDREGR